MRTIMNDILSEKVINEVREVLVQQLDVPQDQITPEARIMGDLGADSLDIVEITMTLEERFDLTIPDEKLDDLETVGDLCRALTDWLEQSVRTV
jgi:acyl carrier protein